MPLSPVCRLNIWYPGLIWLAFEDICNPLTCMTISIWVACMRHLVVFILIFKKKFECFIDGLFISSYQFQRAGINTFRPFGCVAHDKNRDTI